MSFFAELRRRNVIKVGMAYAVTAWLLMQVTDIAFPRLGLPEWTVTLVFALLAIGFFPALIFAWAFELTPEGLKKEKDVDRSQSITHQTGRKLDFAIIGILSVAVVFLLVYRFTETESDRAQARSYAEDAVGGGSAAESTNEKSIAVLPFVNMSDDAGNEYFSDGITEEILNSLAKVQGLQVAGRTSSFAFKGQNQDLRQIGAALGVNHILEGSVRKAGDTVRITAQLIQVDNGFHLWSDSYDRELTDVFAIQDEIANAILAELKAQLVDGERLTVVTPRTSSEAYDLYLLARQRMYERSRLPLESAAELLDQAIAIDPGYAPAYAQKGVVTLLLAEDGYGTIPQAEAGVMAKAQFDKALMIDPQLAEAWAGLGLYHYRRPGEIQQAIDDLQRALSINPNLIDAANWLHNAYNRSARPAEANQVLQGVVKRDPLYKPGVINLVLLYQNLGEVEKAVDLLERTRPYLRGDPVLLIADSGLSYTRGQIAEGLRFAEAALEQSPTDRVFRSLYSEGLLQTHQYEPLAAEGAPVRRVQALTNLGRVEEAGMLAEQLAAQSDPSVLFRLLNQTGRSAELVAYLESHWPNLDALETACPANGRWGHLCMIEAAYAYRVQGQDREFTDAARRVRAAHDALREQGVSNESFWANEASYYAIVGDQAQAIRYLASSIDSGSIFSSPISREKPWFREFEGDPEYEAIQARMIEHLNRERAALDLEPVST